MQREPGFYWVKWRKDWTIGLWRGVQWGSPEQYWDLAEEPGQMFSDGEFAEIGPRITPPEEKE